jgi:hypothetical protein
MFRWQSLRDFSFPDVMTARGNSRKVILQGVEWKVPGHEHCSVGVIADQFDRKRPNSSAIAEFECRFDEDDPDTCGGALQATTPRGAQLVSRIPKSTHGFPSRP